MGGLKITLYMNFMEISKLIVRLNVSMTKDLLTECNVILDEAIDTFVYKMR